MFIEEQKTEGRKESEAQRGAGSCPKYPNSLRQASKVLNMCLFTKSVFEFFVSLVIDVHTCNWLIVFHITHFYNVLFFCSLPVIDIFRT